jgi:Lrp/AsnC family transcriptional regulator, regulator for asnA, asnC and gidA
MQPDKIDWKIINILSQKYVPNSRIAKELGLSEGAIRQRIRKLQTAGILRIKALCDPNVLENQQLAVVTANVAEAKLLDAKAREISKLENVQAVSIVSGRYDLFIEVLVDSNKGLIRFLTEDLSTIDGISKTETFVTLKSYRKFI